jgi:hypothetical protein
MTDDLPPLPEKFRVLVEQSDTTGVWTKQHVPVWTTEQMQTYTRAAIAPYKAEIERLNKENSTLAAGQCIVDNGLLGDDYGHQYCAVQAENAKLLELLVEARQVMHVEHSIRPDYGWNEMVDRIDAALKAHLEGR